VSYCIGFSILWLDMAGLDFGGSCGCTRIDSEVTKVCYTVFASNLFRGLMFLLCWSPFMAFYRVSVVGGPGADPLEPEMGAFYYALPSVNKDVDA